MKFLVALVCLFFLSFHSAANQTPAPSYSAADLLFKRALQSGEYSAAFAALSKELEKNVSDSFNAEILMRLGYVESALNKIDSSIFFFKKALVIWQSQHNLEKLGRTYIGIGSQYNLKKNYPEGEEYFKIALENVTSPADSIKVLIGMLIADIHQKKYDKAYKEIKSGILNIADTSVHYRLYYTNEGQGVYFLYKEQFDSALKYFEAAINYAPGNRYKGFIYNDIAETYRKLKKYSTAFAYQDSAGMNAGSAGWAENLQLNYDTYSRLYGDVGDYKKAFLYADSGRHLSDSFFDVAAATARLDAEAKYKNQQTLAEKAVAETEVSIKQRNLVLTLFGLGIVALLALAGMRVAQVRKKANTVLTSQKRQVQLLADELSMANQTKARLFSTIGHDLRSPVSSLYALLKLEERKGQSQNNEMSDHTVQLLDTLEELLVWSKSQMEGFVLQTVKIDIKDLFEELGQFYAASAREKNISVVYDIQHVSIRTDENILKAILRNMISNAIAHTAPGNEVTFSAEAAPGNKALLSVKNPCNEESFNRFAQNFESSEIKSNAHGFGTVLIKEFARKITADTSLSYKHHLAVLSIIV